ncbi:MAG: hypothetical protein GF364_21185 [Candidatus Lokiarchaeota archaeon]|nr:hypothetical protein [Candidatus Lokiarchaeota archaeon]
MSYQLTLQSQKGTSLLKNKSNFLEIQFKAEDIEITDLNSKILVIVGYKIQVLDELLEEKELDSLRIKPFQEYMIVNLHRSEIYVTFSESIKDHSIIYNPYYYEHEDHKKIDPVKFKEKHPEFNIRENYVDTLPKWYSIKFTYENENLIFVRPRIGISIQKHKLRTEHWDILMGNPIIISGNIVHYNVEKGQKFDHPVQSLHSIINPTDDWVAIKEKYDGKFKEKDIVRVFNPNNYHD